MSPFLLSIESIVLLKAVPKCDMEKTLALQAPVFALNRPSLNILLCVFFRFCSPDGHYVIAGSSDGSLFVWNVYKNKVENVLRQHQNAVVACSWCPTGASLLSCDKQHNVTYWADFWKTSKEILSAKVLLRKFGRLLRHFERIQKNSGILWVSNNTLALLVLWI